jgi:hypothetical protein
VERAGKVEQRVSFQGQREAQRESQRGKHARTTPL